MGHMNDPMLFEGVMVENVIYKPRIFFEKSVLIKICSRNLLAGNLNSFVVVSHWVLVADGTSFMASPCFAELPGPNEECFLELPDYPWVL